MSLKDKVIYFLIRCVIVPPLFIAVMIFAIREEIEHRRSYGRKGSIKQGKSSDQDMERH